MTEEQKRAALGVLRDIAVDMLADTAELVAAPSPIAERLADHGATIAMLAKMLACLISEQPVSVHAAAGDPE